ncbi:MAG: NfeD family protein [Clostridiales bacterium]|nr:NfeD family protein [Clostridiales bacterium]
MTVYWLIALVVLLLIEAVTFGLTTIWFAFGCFLAMLCALLKLQFWVQFVVFLVGSVAAILLMRPLAVKWLKLGKERTNADRLIGEIGLVTQAIDNLTGTGLVHIEGQTWTARSDDGEPIEEGAQVMAVRISGVKLFVHRVR